MNYDKDFVVHVVTQTESMAVQERFFHDGIYWPSGEKTFRRSVLTQYGGTGCIRFDIQRRVIFRGSFQFYESLHYTIISAADFLALHANQVMFLQPKEVR